MQTTLSQLGWSVSAPSLGEIAYDDSSIQNCLSLNSTLGDDEQLHKFRLRLDGTFIDGEGQILFNVRDVSGLSKALYLPIVLYPAAPQTVLMENQNQ